MSREAQLLVRGRADLEHEEQVRLALGLIVSAPRLYFPHYESNAIVMINTLSSDDDVLTGMVSRWAKAHNVTHFNQSGQVRFQPQCDSLGIIFCPMHEATCAAHSLGMAPGTTVFVDPAELCIAPWLGPRRRSPKNNQENQRIEQSAISF